MTIRVAIVADDLTGALDTGTPFVDAGLTVAVALDVDAVKATIATGAEVVVVNTVSRALDAVHAADRVRQATAALCRASPEFVLKKIDSRLKGNVAAESKALALAIGRHHLLVAPAVPDQQRHTRDSHVVGFGVPEPLPIAPHFSDSGIEVQIANAASDDDLDGVVESLDWSKTVAVGGARPRPCTCKAACPTFSADTLRDLTKDTLCLRLARSDHRGADDGSARQRPYRQLPRCTGR
ncbi:hypothetical protein ABIA27_002882 [Sinorhizobium fredii]